VHGASTQYDFETVVIGAGLVGLATARELALAGREVLVLEAADRFGTGSSSRNSEVIHSGIYYSQGTLKARLCVAGRELLYAYCRARNVPHRQIGKLIVAVADSEIPVLQHYRELALANGVGELPWLSAAEVCDLEPAVSCVQGIYSPMTGIVDSHELMLALLADLEAANGNLALRSPFIRAAVSSSGFELKVGGDTNCTLVCRELVNCAGLSATTVARSISGLPTDQLPVGRYAKGYYYSLVGRSPFRRLVYPVAESGGLGIHVTLDLGGGARFGPDVEWVDTIDYSFDDSRRERFERAIRRYYPSLESSRLQPAYTGIRSKIVGTGEPAADFRIDGSSEHGVPGLVNLMGIESPGLTAALAIGKYVREMLCGPIL
jgi:L-2-hydroxyglutarate oxidase LhgO